ncbi:MAG: carboxymuconolactone decarboxylase family protein [Chloroflexota bacterium]
MPMHIERNRSDVEEEIRETMGIVPSFFDEIPDELLDKEWQLLKHWDFGETLIPNKYKELLMLAVNSETRCRYCTLFHTEAAKMFGATDEEIQEAVHLAKHTVGWSVYLNGMRQDYDDFAAEIQEIGEYMMEPA